MPAFGSNAITCAFARRILYEPVKGFRLSDRIVSALDRFIGGLSRFLVPGQPGVMARWLWIYPFVGAADWTNSLNLADAPGAGYLSGGAGDFNKFSISWSGPVVHNNFGVVLGGGTGNLNCDMADITGNPAAWNRRSHGFYSRSDSVYANYDMVASFLETNGYTYTQGIIARHTDGKCYGDLVNNFKSGSPSTPNRNLAVTADSLGLFSDTQRGQPLTPSHFMYKRGVLLGGYENSAEIGMGFGAGPPAYMTLNGARNLAFCFSTRHPWALEASVNPDGTGGTLGGTNADFNFFVEQLQVALTRNV